MDKTTLRQNDFSIVFFSLILSLYRHISVLVMCSSQYIMLLQLIKIIQILAFSLFYLDEPSLITTFQSVNILTVNTICIK